VSQLFLPILRSISSNNNPFFTKRITGQYSRPAVGER
jgi:hypothetical protein